MGQSSSNLLKKQFATWQHTSLSTSIEFYDIFAQPWTEFKILRYAFRFLFQFFFAFPFSPFLFFSFRFLIKFLRILVDISRPIESITLIWVSLERSFPPTEVEYGWCQFCSKVMTSKQEERPRHVTLQVTGGKGVSALNKSKQRTRSYCLHNSERNDMNSRYSGQSELSITMCTGYSK